MEIGVKTDFLDGRVSSNIAYFDIEQTDLQRTITVPDPLNPGFTFNACVQNGVEVARGVEVNVNASVAGGLQILAGDSYLDAFVKSNVQVPGLVGTALLAAPEHKFTTFLRYNLPKTLLKGAYVSFGYIWQDRTNGNSQFSPLTDAPAWETFSAGAGYSFQVWQRKCSLRITADNLFDKYYWPTTGSPGNPLSVKCSVRVEF